MAELSFSDIQMKVRGKRFPGWKTASVRAQCHLAGGVFAHRGCKHTNGERTAQLDLMCCGKKKGGVVIKNWGD